MEVPQGEELKAVGDQPRGAAIAAEALWSQISGGTSLDTLRALERSGQVSPGAMTYQSRSPHEQESPQVITSSKGRLQTEDMQEDPREASYKASKTTAENIGAATEELKDCHNRITGATAALIVVVREAGEGPWEARSGPMEGALLGWTEEQIDWMEDLKESRSPLPRDL